MAGIGEDEIRGGAVIRVGLERGERFTDQQIRNALHVLTPETEPPRDLRNGLGFSRGSAQNVPARLALAVRSGNRLCVAPQLTGQLVDVSDDQRHQSASLLAGG